MIIREKVLDLINKFGTNNPYLIAENFKEIEIIKYPLHESVRGMYYYYKRNKIIFINNTLELRTQRFVCAHELGHCIMHPKVNVKFLKNNTFFATNKYEQQANCFATQLLLTDNILCEYEGYSFHQIAGIEAIPVELVVERIKDFQRDFIAHRPIQ